MSDKFIDSRPFVATSMSATFYLILREVATAIWEEAVSLQLQFVEETREYYVARTTLVYQHSLNFVVGDDDPL
ncbi:hypothetical protein L195_g011097 [Trifolium pratense]|uniref:Uncharacterized protein n=1 Tax=Trifolium pratense TaxID=57577 RepID=A0A2K3PGI9_TRIPR|nr:hypothetical protein L195_g011097 [Trifolium pratense]